MLKNTSIEFLNSLVASGPNTEQEELLDALKDRFNYASYECAARVLATNKGARGSSAILQPKYRDSYMLNRCQFSEKFVVVELCQEVRIDTLVLANYEFFSGMVRDVTVWTSRKYPPPHGKWRFLGRFVTENSRRAQVFPVSDLAHETGIASTFARYVKIEMGNHYGSEYYCPLSSLQIYGKTMMEDFEEQDEKPVIAKAIEEDSLAGAPFPERPTPSIILMPAISTSAAVGGQENIFKAISARLLQLERDVSSTKQPTSDINSSTGQGTRLKRFVRKVTEEMIKETELGQAKKRDRLLWLMVLFAGLQLVVLAILVWRLFFYTPPMHLSTLTTRASSFSRKDSPLPRRSWWGDQLVPVSAIIEKELLLASVRTPFVPEDEAALIDAVYVPSPKSSLSSKLDSPTERKLDCSVETKKDVNNKDTTEESTLL